MPKLLISLTLLCLSFYLTHSMDFKAVHNISLSNQDDYYFELFKQVAYHHYHTHFYKVLNWGRENHHLGRTEMDILLNELYYRMGQRETHGYFDWLFELFSSFDLGCG